MTTNDLELEGVEDLELDSAGAKAAKRYCLVCGNPLVDDDEFCPACRLIRIFIAPCIREVPDDHDD